MKRSSVFLMAFALVLYLGIPAFAQHGRGFGGGVGGGFGGRPSTLGGEGRGNSGSEKGLPTEQRSKGEVFKDNTASTGKKTASDLLTQNTKLSSNLQGLLPTGTNLQNAAKGFDHLGQFVAAVHVSHNLGIPFDQLKAKMMNGDSLGSAIHELRPNVDARQEAIKANQQALEDMEKSVASNKPATAGK
ncbi:hypothetical protein EPO44_14735 [bacterium]|nr:MAG: hypothetical protein EPO44_14735 [bacterium]